jgi:hypothetical protein
MVNVKEIKDNLAKRLHHTSIAMNANVREDRSASPQA